MDLSIEWWQWGIIFFLLAAAVVLLIVGGLIGLLAKTGFLALLASLVIFLARHLLTEAALKVLKKFFRWLALRFRMRKL